MKGLGSLFVLNPTKCSSAELHGERGKGHPVEAYESDDTGEVQSAIFAMTGREAKFSQAQQTIYLLLIGADWASGEPLKAMAEKLAKYESQVTVAEVRSNTRCSRFKRMPPRPPRPGTHSEKALNY